MTRTEYLTGEKPVYDPFLEEFATNRIQSMRNLLTELGLATRDLEVCSPEWEEIHTRYKEVETGIKWWRRFMNEHEEKVDEV